MSVLMFALDSMSHLSWQRLMPKTYKYIQEVLGAVVMQGYNIVGDATTAAIIPMMTGRERHAFLLFVRSAPPVIEYQYSVRIETCMIAHSILIKGSKMIYR